MACKHLLKCGFIEKISGSMPQTAQMVKIKFCEYHITRCAIYKVAEIVSMENVPEEISNNGK
jgi:hypothetical protein